MYLFISRYFADYVDCKCKLGQKIGRPLFILPLNVLELVYGQSLIWYVFYASYIPLPLSALLTRYSPSKVDFDRSFRSQRSLGTDYSTETLFKGSFSVIFTKEFAEDILVPKLPNAGKH